MYHNGSIVITGGRCARNNICAVGVVGALGYSSAVVLSLAMISTSAACVCSITYRKGLCCNCKFCNRLLATSARVVRHERAISNYSSVVVISVSCIRAIRISAAITVGSKRICIVKKGAVSAPKRCSVALADSGNYSSVIRLALIIRANIGGLRLKGLVVTPGPVGINRITCVVDKLDKGSYKSLVIRILGSIKRVICEKRSRQFPMVITNVIRHNICLVHIISYSNGVCTNGLVIE